MKSKLARHQLFASSMIDTMDAIGLAYEMGTGKTMCALDWAYNAHQRGDLNSLLVICPASLVSNWRDAIQKMSQFEGYTDEGIQSLDAITTIVSFQKTYKTEMKTTHHRNGRVETHKVRVLRPEVKKIWDAIVIDEAHSIGRHNSIQTKMAVQLGDNFALKKIIMTGTPVSGGGGAEDYRKLYGQIRFLTKKEWTTWGEFCDKCIVSFDYFGNPTLYNRAVCQDIMRRYYIVARLEDCYDMPDYTETVMDCPLSEPTVYNDVRLGKLDKYDLSIETSGAVYGKLLQICSGGVKTKTIKDGETVEGYLSLTCSKDQVLRTIIEGTDDKVVVFCNYRASVDRVYDILKEYGSAVVFDGRSKTETWKEFRDGDVQFLVCQYQSGGTGIDLYTSHTMVFYEPCWSALLLEQSKARIYRKGQTKHCSYYYLNTPGTIEARVTQNVRNGVDVTVDMLNQWAKE